MINDLSIIIPTYGKENALGLWSTIESSVLDLESSGLTYDFRICLNGTETPDLDFKNIENHLKKSGKLSKWLHVREAQGTTKARHLLAHDCNSKYMFMFDSHCIPSHGYFKRAIDTMEKYNIDLLHSVTKMFTGFRLDYEYKLTLEKNFWAEEGYTTPRLNEPYKIAVAGHGGIVHRTSTYKEIGGYWTELNGYGGEEVYYDLKCNLFGKQVFIDPQIMHAHWAPIDRGYQRKYSHNYFLNMLMVANVIGGESWINKVFLNLKNKSVLNTDKELFADKTDILDIDNLVDKIESNKPSITVLDESYLYQAKMLSKKHAEWIASKRKLTLNELLTQFKREGIRT